MTKNQSKRLILAAVLGISIPALFWLFNSGEGSPIYSYVLDHPSIGNMLTYLSMPAVLGGMAVSGNVHEPSVVVTYALLAVQWAFIGYLLSLAIFRTSARV